MISLIFYLAIAEFMFILLCREDARLYNSPLPWQFVFTSFVVAIVWPISILLGYLLTRRKKDTK